ncbi:imm11 family protein [Sphingomonas alpina]|uniref:Immunity MXAN-0049 protein domain-containing protein n=1 Tax=Sphingomonas alpina TaxID=653931 RepID=A0A7H0LJU4_9SPHN|nr:DUF1629 domain-containing protein [Sphingomonas alpina]QNQ09947.1 hypothetical protein H3Z74_01440 [Sphingomonas alpina]
MAWLRCDSILIEDCPTLEWDERSKDWLKTVRAKQRQPLEALPPEHPDHVWQFGGPSGIPYPESPAFPLVTSVVHSVGPLPDHSPPAGASSRFKDAVERFEPGVHQFFPMEVLLEDGTVDKSRWLMHICNRVDAIALEHCADVYEYRPKPDQHPGWYYYRSNFDSRTRIAVRKSMISGKALWYDLRLQRFFLGQELGQFLIENGFRGYDLPCDGLGRSQHVEEV